MKNKPEIVMEACRYREEGMSYNKISKQLKKKRKIRICSATAYNWAKKYRDSNAFKIMR